MLLAVSVLSTTFVTNTVLVSAEGEDILQAEYKGFNYEHQVKAEPLYVIDFETTEDEEKDNNAPAIKYRNGASLSYGEGYNGGTALQTTGATSFYLPLAEPLTTGQYSISLTDMNQYYIWDFKTAEGKFSLLPIEVFKADGKTPTDLATAQVGDSLKIKLSVFNSIELKEDFTALLTACLYSENSLDGFEYENITIDSSNKVFTETVDFTVTDNTDLKVKGFLWKALGTRTPIAEEVEAK